MKPTRTCDKCAAPIVTINGKDVCTNKRHDPHGDYKGNRRPRRENMKG